MKHCDFLLIILCLWSNLFLICTNFHIIYLLDGVEMDAYILFYSIITGYESIVSLFDIVFFMKLSLLLHLCDL